LEGSPRVPWPGRFRTGLFPASTAHLLFSLCAGGHGLFRALQQPPKIQARRQRWRFFFGFRRVFGGRRPRQPWPCKSAPGAWSRIVHSSPLMSPRKNPRMQKLRCGASRFKLVNARRVQMFVVQGGLLLRGVASFFCAKSDSACKKHLIMTRGPFSPCVRPGGSPWPSVFSEDLPESILLPAHPDGRVRVRTGHPGSFFPGRNAPGYARTASHNGKLGRQVRCQVTTPRPLQQSMKS